MKSIYEQIKEAETTLGRKAPEPLASDHLIVKKRLTESEVHDEGETLDEGFHESAVESLKDKLTEAKNDLKQKVKEPTQKTPKQTKAEASKPAKIPGDTVSDSDWLSDLEGEYPFEKYYQKLDSDDMRAINKAVIYFDTVDEPDIKLSTVQKALEDHVGSEVYAGGALAGIAERSGLDKGDIVNIVQYLHTGDKEIKSYPSEAEKLKDIKESEDSPETERFNSNLIMEVLYGYASDEMDDDEDLANFLVYVADRVNQSYPDDVSLTDLKTLSDELDTREYEKSFDDIKMALSSAGIIQTDMGESEASIVNVEESSTGKFLDTEEDEREGSVLDEEGSDELKTMDVYQIDLSDIHDDINELGWSKAEDKYPKVRAYLAVSLRGSKNYEKEFFDSYDKVVVIKAAGLEDAFKLLNGADSSGEIVDQVAPYHSLSVGDIVVTDGKKYMVDSFGFSEPLEERESIRDDNNDWRQMR